MKLSFVRPVGLRSDVAIGSEAFSQDNKAQPRETDCEIYKGKINLSGSETCG